MGQIDFIPANTDLHRTIAAATVVGSQSPRALPASGATAVTARVSMDARRYWRRTTENRDGGGGGVRPDDDSMRQVLIDWLEREAAVVLCGRDVGAHCIERVRPIEKGTGWWAAWGATAEPARSTRFPKTIRFRRHQDRWSRQGGWWRRWNQPSIMADVIAVSCKMK